MTRTESLICVVASFVAAWSVYVAHVMAGGWYLDDWINVALMRDAGSFSGALNVMNNITYRPGLALSLALFHKLAGSAPAGYLAIAVVITAIQTGLFYAVLRALKFNIFVAALAGMIFLVLPAIDATRLWMSAAPIQIAGALYLCGVLVALKGLRQTSFGSQVAWHIGAVALFVGAMLTYELIAGVIVVTWMLYVVQNGPRSAAWRLAADWGSVAVTLYLLAQRAVDDRGANTTLGHLWDRAQQMVAPAEGVFTSLLPWSKGLGGKFGLLLLAAGIVGALVAIRDRSSGARGLKMWLGIAAVSLAFALAGLVLLLPADPYFIPRLSGLGNRVGAFAAFGAVVLLIAVIVIACGGIGALFRRPAAGFAVAIMALAITTGNLALREIRQQGAWARAWEEQVGVLSSVNTALDGRISPKSAVVTFRHTTFILPADVSVFAYGWDLRGALMNVFHMPTAYGHPWMDGSRCGSDGVIFQDGVGEPSGAAPYGYSDDLVFVDASAATAQRVRSKSACERVVTALTGKS